MVKGNGLGGWGWVVGGLRVGGWVVRIGLCRLTVWYWMGRLGLRKKVVKSVTTKFTPKNRL